MKFAAFLLAVLVALAPLTVSAEAKNVKIAIDDEAIVYMGRWINDGGLMRGSFECGLTLRFTGTSIKLDGKASGSVLLAIDGGEVSAKSLSKGMTLFKDLAEGEHTLELYAAAQRGFPVISGFVLDEGASVLPTEKGKIVEFVGDSIMEGYVNPNDAGDFGANSYRNSYGFLTGRKLMQNYGMRFSTIAYGGIRIVERGDNESNNDPMGMPERYFAGREYKVEDGNLASSRKAAGTWDTSLYAPDFIVINLGTNDRGGDSNRISMEFYKYLKKLNETYPNAIVLVMEPFLKGVTENLQTAIKLAHNDNNVLVATEDWKIPAGYDNCHPAPAAHEKAAGFLYDVIEKYLADTPDDTTPTEDPSGAPADEPTADPGGATDTPGEQTKASFNAVPYAIGGGAVIAAAIVAAVAVGRKKKKG